MKKQIQRFQDFMWKILGHPKSMWFLGIIAFCESIFFPLPPDPYILGLSLKKPHKWYKFVLAGLTGSITGAFIGYFIGNFFWTSLEPHILGKFISVEMWEKLAKGFSDHTAEALIVAAFSPLPFKVFVLAAGALKAPFMAFILASLLGRGVRFTIIGYAGKLGRERSQTLLKIFKSKIFYLLFIGAVVLIGVIKWLI